jgi:hypothetical protein
VSTPIWPPDLPQKMLVEGYGRGFADGRLRTQTDTGPGKMRRRYSSAVKPVTGQFMVSSDEAARLERFWDEETSGGSKPFLIPNQTNDGLTLETASGDELLASDGSGVALSSWWLVMFGDAPNVAPLSGAVDLYRVTIQLNVMP